MTTPRSPPLALVLSVEYCLASAAKIGVRGLELRVELVGERLVLDQDVAHLAALRQGVDGGLVLLVLRQHLGVRDLRVAAHLVGGGRGQELRLDAVAQEGARHARAAELGIDLVLVDAARGRAGERALQRLLTARVDGARLDRDAEVLRPGAQLGVVRERLRARVRSESQSVVPGTGNDVFIDSCAMRIVVCRSATEIGVPSTIITASGGTSLPELLLPPQPASSRRRARRRLHRVPRPSGASSRRGRRARRGRAGRLRGRMPAA